MMKKAKMYLLDDNRRQYEIDSLQRNVDTHKTKAYNYAGNAGFLTAIGVIEFAAVGAVGGAFGDGFAEVAGAVVAAPIMAMGAVSLVGAVGPLAQATRDKYKLRQCVRIGTIAQANRTNTL